ncbi:DUF6441 family protein [Pseudorhodoplanes sp.]|uniref:DUF6441 family protein n=1 Tax=Pseudorhodoplanes sp. TaxID=1934341 RepID=UPI00391A7CFF
MRFSLKADDLTRGLKSAEGDVARSVTAAMRRAAEGMKGDLRADVLDAGLGQRLANTWRGRTFPENGASIEAAAFVWSKAPNIVDAFDRGVTIRSNRGFWLAIPTPAAGKMGLTSTGARKRIMPGGWERRTGMRLRFVYRRGAPSLLVADNARLTKRGLARANTGRSRGGATYTRLAGRSTVVVFILVSQVTLRRRLDIDGIAQRWAARVGPLLVQNWR